MASLNEIRTTFLEYFRTRDHEVVESSPLVPQNDPTLMFVNSGMVQFKNIFTGIEKRDYSRAVTSQKCVRAGGKHNDLDNVGYTARHHTFFEMLGNFSFGDYFKERAIPLAWDLITRDFGIPAERLLVTVYAEDDEAAAIWSKYAGLGDERIIKISTSDNFWSMGATGPCGPCTEIFYDHGDRIAGGPPGSADEDGDRFVEIWNLVFMQYEQFEDGRREQLPRPSIDTGMGLERIGALLQGKSDNYDTDLMRTLIEASANASSTDPDGPHAMHHRVIADHLRSTSFLIAEGVMPSNEGRGYVLRRIMRRAMRHAHMLGATDPLMYRLVPELVRMMGQAFPELQRGKELIEETLRTEELRFKSMLDRGLRMLSKAVDDLPEGSPLPGEFAFRLYDTYGFPFDLTQDALRDLGVRVEKSGFDREMARQREIARKSWKGSGDPTQDAIWFKLAEKHGKTEFLGHEHRRSEAVIEALVVDARAAEKAIERDTVSILCNQSPFYAESGGQVGDTGRIWTDTGTARVDDTLGHAELHVHRAVIESGFIEVGQTARLEIDRDRRALVMANHSATHLLNEALRRVLGSHVAQRGSLNDAERLRFDFSHTGGLTLEEIEQVEGEVNRYITQDSPVETRLLPLELARETGAQALFGEKYSDEVRVVFMGNDPESGRGPHRSSYSVELCGGTHVKRTGQIGLFVVTGESALASGIRRIEALTGETARLYLSIQDMRLAQIALQLKTGSDGVVQRVGDLLKERKALRAEVNRLNAQLAVAGSESGSSPAAATIINGVRFQAVQLEGVGGKQLPELIDRFKTELGSGVVLLVSSNNGKAAVAAGVTNDLVERISAIDIVRHVTQYLGGRGGGGRPDFARGGGSRPEGAGRAIEAARQMIEELQ